MAGNKPLAIILIIIKCHKKKLELVVNQTVKAVIDINLIPKALVLDQAPPQQGYVSMMNVDHFKNF